LQTLVQLRAIESFNRTFERAQKSLEQGRLSQSERLFRRAIVAGQATFGSSHIKVAEALWYLANALRLRGTDRHTLRAERSAKLIEAVKLGDKSLAIRIALGSEKEEGLAQWHENLAYFCRDSGDSVRAIFHMTRALAIEKSLGHELTDRYIHSTGHLASFFMNVQDGYAAERVLKRALKLWAKLHGEKDTRDTWYVYDWLSQIYKERAESLRKLEPNHAPANS
jgi:tetratricopeptide (TPR) repeat protein